MSTNRHLIELERQLEEDLADARRHIELGRRNAIDEIHSRRESLGDLCLDAALKIELLASDAKQELRRIRSRLGELNLMLAVEEICDLETFDQFRDRVLRAMSDAAEDLGALDRDGEEWVVREAGVSDAWGALSRQLGVARMHLAHESQVAEQAFELERGELAMNLGEAGELVDRVGEKPAAYRSGSEEVSFREGELRAPGRPGARHD